MPNLSNLNKSHIDIIHDELGKIEEHLDIVESNFVQSTYIDYVTEHGEKEFNCNQNGYIDDIRIKGKTYCNSWVKNSTWNVSADTTYAWIFNDIDTGSGTFTIINTSDKKIKVEGKDSSGNITSYIDVNGGQKILFTINEGSNLRTIVIASAHGWTIDNASFKIAEQSIIILKGDYTNDDIIEYFEGIKSIGEGNNIELYMENPNVEEVALRHIHLYPGNSNGNGTFTVTNTTNGFTGFIYINGGSVKLSRNGHIHLYDRNHNYIRVIMNAGTEEHVVNDAVYIRIWIAGYTNPLTIYHKPLYDKQIIETELYSMPNGISDYIEKKDGKYIKVKKCDKIVLDGSRNWMASTTNNTSYSYLVFYLRDLDIFKNMTKSSKVDVTDRICDIFEFNKNINQANNDGEGVFVGEFNEDDNWNIRISIAKSKLSTPDVAGFKSWLVQNPVTIIYQLAGQITEEFYDINLKTKEGTNKLLLNTKIPADISFKLTNTMTDSLEVLKNKIGDLDNRLTSVFQLGANVKANIVDTLVAKGYSVSTDNTFEELVNVIESLEGDTATINNYINQINNLNTQIGALQTQLNSSRQCHIGTVTSTSDLYQFYDQYEASCKHYLLTVDNIPFLPKTILVLDRYNQTIDITFYDDVVHWNGKKLYSFTQSFARRNTIWYTMYLGNSQIRANGFSLPAYYANTTYTYIAFS